MQLVARGCASGKRSNFKIKHKKKVEIENSSYSSDDYLTIMQNSVSENNNDNFCLGNF